MYILPDVFTVDTLKSIAIDHLVLYFAVAMLAALVGIIYLRVYTRNITNLVISNNKEHGLYWDDEDQEDEVLQEYYDDNYLIPPLREYDGRLSSKPDTQTADSIPQKYKQEYRPVLIQPYEVSDQYLIMHEDEEEEEAQEMPPPPAEEESKVQLTSSQKKELKAYKKQQEKEQKKIKKEKKKLLRERMAQRKEDEIAWKIFTKNNNMRNPSYYNSIQFNYKNYGNDDDLLEEEEQEEEGDVIYHEVLPYSGEGPYLYRWLFKPTHTVYNNAHYRGLAIFIFFIMACIAIFVLAGQVKSNQVGTNAYAILDTVDVMLNDAIVVSGDTSDRLTVFANSTAGGIDEAAVISTHSRTLATTIYSIWGASYATIPVILDFHLELINITANKQYERTILDAFASLHELGYTDTVLDESDIPPVDFTTVNNTFNDVADIIINATLIMQDMYFSVVNDIPPITTNMDSLTTELGTSVVYMLQVQELLGSLLNRTSIAPPMVEYWNARRLAVTFAMYAFPLIISCVGVLGLVIRGARIMRTWYHLTLIFAFLCFFFSAIFLLGSILVTDVCNQPMSVFAATFRTLYPVLDRDMWFGPVLKYFPQLGECEEGEDVLDAVPEPTKTSLLYSMRDDLQKVRDDDYVAGIRDAQNILRSGLVAMTNLTVLGNFSINNSFAKLDNISREISDLSRFGFDQKAYDESLQDINDLTSDFYATEVDEEGNEVRVHYSFYYGFGNYSTINVNNPPYSNADEAFRDQLQDAISATNALTVQYNRVMVYVSLGREAVAEMEENLVRYQAAEEDLHNLRTQTQYAIDYANYYIADVQATKNSLNAAIDDTVPQLNDYIATWLWARDAARCDFIGDAKDKLVHHLCGSGILSSFTTWTTTFGLSGLFLLFAHVAALFGGHIFTKNYMRYPHVSLIPKWKWDNIRALPEYFKKNFEVPSLPKLPTPKLPKLPKIVFQR